MRHASNTIRASFLACLALLAAPEMASGADLGAYDEHMVVVETTRNWSGLYLGGFAGASFSDVTATAPAYAVSASESTSSTIFGLYGGYQRQFGRFVLGAEVDWSKAASGDGASLFTVRGRLGYDFGRFLAYATAGWGHESLDVPSGLPGAALIDDSLSGYVIGGGADFWLSNRVSGRVEALYFSPSSMEIPMSAILVGATGPLEIDIDQTLVRAGLTYHFN